MKEDQEELSVNDVLSSIRTAVLETKSPSADLKEPKENKTKKSDMTVEDVYVLTENMRLKNSSNNSLSTKDFDKTSESLLKKYAKIFATWQSFE